MTTELTDWPRDSYMPGGGDALILYFIYGPVDISAPLSRAKYRVAGIPDSLEISQYTAQEHPEGLNAFREGPMWDMLVEQDPGLAQLINAQDVCIALRGEIEDPATLNYLRDVVGLIAHFGDHGGVAVLDAQTLSYWRVEDWKARYFEPQPPDLAAHTTILVSDDSDGEDPDGGEWLHTRGMRKFGRPDLSLRSLPPEHRTAAASLFNQLIEMQARGARIDDGQRINMEGLPDVLTCRNGGDLDNPDFNNIHIELAMV